MDINIDKKLNLICLKTKLCAALNNYFCNIYKLQPLIFNEMLELLKLKYFDNDDKNIIVQLFIIIGNNGFNGSCGYNEKLCVSKIIESIYYSNNEFLLKDFLNCINAEPFYN
jgi:hypothetical protein